MILCQVVDDDIEISEIKLRFFGFKKFTRLSYALNKNEIHGIRPWSTLDQFLRVDPKFRVDLIIFLNFNRFLLSCHKNEEARNFKIDEG
uniref:Uncharacterized protein n=1 Tax=Strongyloides venezuelensis TaxID=75913 RepID=A0A0K0FW02_STRVS